MGQMTQRLAEAWGEVQRLAQGLFRQGEIRKVATFSRLLSVGIAKRVIWLGVQRVPLHQALIVQDHAIRGWSLGPGGREAERPQHQYGGGHEAERMKDGKHVGAFICTAVLSVSPLSLRERGQTTA